MGWLPIGLWGRRKRILVIEDSPTTSAVIADILRSFNYDALVAATGADGLAAIQTRRPDLVLLDVLLPDMNGSIICQRLKADPATWDIPVVYLTSKSETTIEQGRTMHSADGYLTKPVSRLQLINRIENIFNRQKK